MEPKVFDRIEKKYLITKPEKKVLLKSIRQNMNKDSYHKSVVFNIYFDNQNFDSIINSIDWVDFKAKVRARSYQGYDRVFLEIKTKIRGKEENLGYKRRVMISEVILKNWLIKNIL
ncbi:VTC domain-containing protein [Candidatus Saccharibacteria bacterium]|nr:VTC domain-containing protein [Candidatus Saccharibacteria bacterium]